ncbi:U2 small nuclear ribonucleoprotein B''-like [Octopus sinensis]|uniref:U2 small nuclear ribonucleoprotein B''-like n=1 Tax=Octopus sinensis TaxID=2607531 RepID=A0A6P7U132_9MOLL|nr:U2 small nuclear ribonucleoprotein B''-like [Octopus sinensis]
MKGQAFVSFKDPASATEAVSSLQGFPFYDKPLVPLFKYPQKIAFAKSESDVISQMNGTYVKPEKRPLTEYNMPANKRNKVFGTGLFDIIKFSGPGVTNLQNQGGLGLFYGLLDDLKTSLNDSNQPPNNILFLNGLPKELSDEELINLFQRFCINAFSYDFLKQFVIVNSDASNQVDL